jgi:hypothetical protein
LSIHLLMGHMALFMTRMILGSLFGILIRQTQKMATGTTYTKKRVATGHMLRVVLSQALGGMSIIHPKEPGILAHQTQP